MLYCSYNDKKFPVPNISSCLLVIQYLVLEVSLQFSKKLVKVFRSKEALMHPIKANQERTFILPTVITVNVIVSNIIKNNLFYQHYVVKFHHGKRTHSLTMIFYKYPLNVSFSKDDFILKLIFSHIHYII